MVVGSFPLLYLYDAMNYQIETPLSAMLTYVHLINFERRKNYGKNITVSMNNARTIQSYCSDDNSAVTGCSYWNPSIFPLNAHRYLIAVRESTGQQCGGVIGTIITLSRLLLKPAISTVLIGSFNPNELIIKGNQLTIRLHQQLPDSFRYNPNAYHRGQEDPRWINDDDRLYLLTVSERRSSPRLFLTKVTLIQFKLDDTTDTDKNDLVEFGETIELKPFLYAPYAQKNWMHVPVPAKDKPKDHPLWLLFVYKISPVLQMVWVDPESGTAMLFDNWSEPIMQEYNMRGSSMFILETPDIYLRLIHTSTRHLASYGDFQLNIYYSYLIRIAKESITRKWTITHKTLPFAIPTAKNVLAHRIQFPTTIIEHDSEFWISMGDMDCDSHILRIPKSSLLQLLR